MTAAVTACSPVAIVTGSNGGIGWAICRQLAKGGHRVVGVDRVENPDPESWTVETHVLDVTAPDQVRAVVDGVADRFRRIDVLVNCAGTAHRGSFAGTTAMEFMTDVESSLLGTFLMSQAVVFPHMESARAGRIVNIASISGKTGGTGPVSPDGSAGRSGPGYAAAKAGVINLTRWVARDVGRLGITCNAVAPGPIRTVLTAGHAYDVGDIPLGRQGTVDEVADAVAWLTSSGAGYVSGTVVDVDGGLVRA
jgi:3-oxoacyl-[acyl-carrier protein] reductase